jgi:hypothetical protein
MHRMLIASLSLFAVAVAGCQTPDAQKDGPQKDGPRALLRDAATIRAQVASVCEHEFKSDVAVRAMTRDELRTYAHHRVDKELGEGRLERMNGWLHCLGLLRRDKDFRTEATALLGAQTAGVYDAEHKVLYLLGDVAGNDEAGISDWYGRYTVSHELAHALDDQYLDLQKVMLPGGRDPTKDQLFALGAAIEGSAIAVSDVWGARSPPPPGYDPFAAPEAREAAVQATTALVAAPPYCQLLLARHQLGRAFYAAGRELRRTEDGRYLGLLSIADALPASTEQILHPEKFWVAEQRDAPVVLANEDEIAAAIAAQTHAKVLDRNTLGELVVAVVAQAAGRKLPLAAIGRPETWTNAAAAGWGGDRLFLVGSAGGTAGAPVADPGVVWITAWDTERDRDEFVVALTKHRDEHPAFTHAEGARAAAFAFGSARALDADALEALLAACRFTQDGAAWKP